MTYSPILREEEMPRWNISRPRPVPRPDTRFVFTDGRGRTYAPPQPITIGEAIWGNLRRMHEVDMAEHSDSFDCQLPCQEKGFYFDAHVQLAWRVHSPEQIVTDRRTEVAGLYRGYLTERLMEASEAFSLEQRAEAERRLKGHLREPARLPEGITITRCTLTLSLGTEAEEHLANRTRVGFASETEELAHQARLERAEREGAAAAAEHKVETLKGQHREEHKVRQFEHEQQIGGLKRVGERDQHRHELDMEKARAEFDRELEKERAQHELDQQHFQLKLEEQRAKFELERAAERERHELTMKAERMKVYSEALARGESGLVVLFLEQHPEDAGSLIDLLRSERKEIQDNSLKVLQAMLDARLLDAVDMDDTKRQALNNLFSGLNTGALDNLLGAKGEQGEIESSKKDEAADATAEPSATAPDEFVVGEVETEDSEAQ